MLGKIKSAMTMPLITLFVIIVVFIYMMLEVVPHVESLYSDLGEELPTLTMVMVGIKDFLINFWWLVIVILGVMVAFFMQWRKTDNGVHVMATIKLNVPMFNGLFRILYMSRFARISQILLSTGVAVLDTILADGFLDSVKEKAAYLRGELEKIPEIESLSGIGMMIGITLKTKDAHDVMLAANDAGLLVLTAKEKLRLLPPLTITKEEMDAGLAILRSVLA